MLFKRTASSSEFHQEEVSLSATKDKFAFCVTLEKDTGEKMN